LTKNLNALNKINTTCRSYSSVFSYKWR